MTDREPPQFAMEVDEPQPPPPINKKRKRSTGLGTTEEPEAKRRKGTLRSTVQVLKKVETLMVDRNQPGDSYDHLVWSQMPEDSIQYIGTGWMTLFLNFESDLVLPFYAQPNRLIEILRLSKRIQALARCLYDMALPALSSFFGETAVMRRWCVQTMANLRELAAAHADALDETLPNAFDQALDRLDLAWSNEEAPRLDSMDTDETDPRYTYKKRYADIRLYMGGDSDSDEPEGPAALVCLSWAICESACNVWDTIHAGMCSLLDARMSQRLNEMMTSNNPDKSTWLIYWLDTFCSQGIFSPNIGNLYLYESGLCRTDTNQPNVDSICLQKRMVANLLVVKVFKTPPPKRRDYDTVFGETSNRLPLRSLFLLWITHGDLNPDGPVLQKLYQLRLRLSDHVARVTQHFITQQMAAPSSYSPSLTRIQNWSNRTRGTSSLSILAGNDARRLSPNDLQQLLFAPDADSMDLVATSVIPQGPAPSGTIKAIQTLSSLLPGFKSLTADYPLSLPSDRDTTASIRLLEKLLPQNTGAAELDLAVAVFDATPSIKLIAHCHYMIMIVDFVLWFIDEYVTRLVVDAPARDILVIRCKQVCAWIGERFGKVKGLFQQATELAAFLELLNRYDVARSKLLIQAYTNIVPSAMDQRSFQNLETEWEAIYKSMAANLDKGIDQDTHRALVDQTVQVRAAALYCYTNLFMCAEQLMYLLIPLANYAALTTNVAPTGDGMPRPQNALFESLLFPTNWILADVTFWQHVYRKEVDGILPNEIFTRLTLFFADENADGRQALGSHHRNSVQLIRQLHALLDPALGFYDVVAPMPTAAFDHDLSSSVRATTDKTWYPSMAVFANMNANATARLQLDTNKRCSLLLNLTNSLRKAYMPRQLANSFSIYAAYANTSNQMSSLIPSHYDRNWDAWLPFCATAVRLILTLGSQLALAGVGPYHDAATIFLLLLKVTATAHPAALTTRTIGKDEYLDKMNPRQINGDRTFFLTALNTKTGPVFGDTTVVPELATPQLGVLASLYINSRTFFSESAYVSVNSATLERQITTSAAGGKSLIWDPKEALKSLVELNLTQAALVDAARLTLGCYGIVSYASYLVSPANQRMWGICLDWNAQTPQLSPPTLSYRQKTDILEEDIKQSLLASLIPFVLVAGGVVWENVVISPANVLVSETLTVAGLYATLRISTRLAAIAFIDVLGFSRDYVIGKSLAGYISGNVPSTVAIPVIVAPFSPAIAPPRGYRAFIYECLQTEFSSLWNRTLLAASMFTVISGHLSYETVEWLLGSIPFVGPPLAKLVNAYRIVVKIPSAVSDAAATTAEAAYAAWISAKSYFLPSIVTEEVASDSAPALSSPDVADVSTESFFSLVASNFRIIGQIYVLIAELAALALSYLGRNNYLPTKITDVLVRLLHGSARIVDAGLVAATGLQLLNYTWLFGGPPMIILVVLGFLLLVLSRWLYSKGRK